MLQNLKAVDESENLTVQTQKVGREFLVNSVHILYFEVGLPTGARAFSNS